MCKIILSPETYRWRYNMSSPQEVVWTDAQGAIAGAAAKLDVASLDPSTTDWLTADDQHPGQIMASHRRIPLITPSPPFNWPARVYF
jgi:hypothetical protein